MSPQGKTKRLWLWLGGTLVVLLAAGVFTLGSLNPPVQPLDRVVLFALSTFIGAALLVFGLVLTRSLLRLLTERRAGQLGSLFKTKMVLGALALSLLPVLFMFLFSYGLMNRTLGKWFPRPLEVATQESRRLRNEFAQQQHERLAMLAETAAQALNRGQTLTQAFGEVAAGADAIWLVGPSGGIEGVAPGAPHSPGRPRFEQILPGGVELWISPADSYFAARAAYGTGALIAARRLPNDFLSRSRTIETETQAYAQQRTGIRSYKSATLMTLLLFTVLLLFSSMWVALFLSKQVTVPIQALAEATQEISQGRFEHRVAVKAQDELGRLVNSFNQMAAQLGESRKQIEDFTRNLQQALEEIEHRRNLLTALLENIPAGVLLLGTKGQVLQVNPGVERILGPRARQASTLAELLGEETTRDLLHLIRKSLRMGTASRQVDIAIAGRLLHTAVTVTPLGPHRAHSGFVVVIDDLSELLRAQKAAAWQEVAQRIAHEIKNPLTPIQLSAQRLARYVERLPAGDKASAGRTELAKVVAECTGLIEREVARG